MKSILFPQTKNDLTLQDLNSLDWYGSVHLASDPAGKSVDVGVDAGLVPPTTALAPAHHAGDVVYSVILTHQGSTWVALQSKKEQVKNIIFPDEGRWSCLWHV